MPGLVPGIHVFAAITEEKKTRMAGTSPAMTRDIALNSALGQWPTWQMKPEENPSFTIN
jgi:hypothetical protein